jgi:hypothetical protein
MVEDEDDDDGGLHSVLMTEATWLGWGRRDPDHGWGESHQAPTNSRGRSLGVGITRWTGAGQASRRGRGEGGVWERRLSRRGWRGLGHCAGVGEIRGLGA